MQFVQIATNYLLIHLDAADKLNTNSAIVFHLCEIVGDKFLFYLDLRRVVQKAEETRWVQNRVFQVPPNLVVAGVANQAILPRLKGKANGSLPLCSVISYDLNASVLCQAEHSLERAKINS